MNCPKCNTPGAEELADEVDIGVGIQKHVYGYECLQCGQLSVCPHCGVLEMENGSPHRAWCQDAPGN